MDEKLAEIAEDMAVVDNLYMEGIVSVEDAEAAIAPWAETLSITGGFVYIENVPVEENEKRQLLIDEVLPLLYAFDRKQVTIRVEIAEPTTE